MRRALKRILTPPLLAVAAILIAAEEILWRLAKIYAWIGKLPLLHRVELWITGLPPYAALVCFAIPTLVVAPFKVLAFYWLASGHAALGAGTIVVAKIAGTALVARIYQLTRAALVTLRWFACCESKVLALRAAAYAIWRNSAIGRWTSIRIAAIRAPFRRWRERRRHWIAVRWQAIRSRFRRRIITT